MKRLAVMLCAVFMLGVAANAQTILNPLYMPNEGQIVSDTEIQYLSAAQGDDDKIYGIQETLSYAFTDRFSAGASIAYAKFDPEYGDSEKDFLNPSIYGMYRVLADDLKLDIGAEVELGLFDNDLVQKDYLFSIFARAGKQIDNLTFGGAAIIGYYMADDSDADEDETYPTEVKGFAWYDLNENFAFGGDVGLTTDDVFGHTVKEGALYLEAKAGYTINENMGVLAGVRYTFNDGSDNNDYAIKAMFRAAFL